MNTNKVAGVIFIVMAGIIYTFERGFSLISTSLIKAGFYSGTMSGEIPEVAVSGLFNNLFVPMFFIIGLALLLYGLKKN